MNDAAPSRGVPVTAAFSRHVKPGRVAEYDAWLHDMTLLASRWPGYQGVTVVRPPHGGVRPEYTSILRFDTEANLRAWLDSAERLNLLARAADYADEPAEEVISEPGVEFWFTPHDAIPLTRPPPRWKMALALVVVVFVIVTIMRWLLAMLLPGAPRPLVTLISVVSQIVLLTYVVMPWLTRRLAFWLTPKDPLIAKPAAMVFADTATRGQER